MTIGLGAALANRQARRIVRKTPTKRIGRRVFKPFKGYRPHAKQRALHTCGARFVVVCAGRRSGKTFSLAREFMRRIFEDLNEFEKKVKEGLERRWRRPRRLGRNVMPALHYWMVAPTYDLCAASQREIFEILGGEDGDRVLKWDASLNQLWLKGGVLIEFKSADRPDRLVSVGLDGMLVDEAARLKKDVWRDNLKPVLDDKEGFALFGTTPLGQNWFFNDLWQLTQLSTDKSRINPDYMGFHFTTMDNTAKPALIREAMRAKKDLPESNWRRNYAADFYAFEGKIYDMYFDNQTHLFKKAPRTFKKKIAGIDWGYRNPGALLTIGISSDDVLYVLDEVYRTGVTVAPAPGSPEHFESWANHVVQAARDGVQVFYADPAQPNHIETCRRALRLAGLDAIILPAKNEVIPGIDAVAAMLKPIDDEQLGFETPALFIAEKARNLRRELSSYQWATGEAPQKEDDHALDALRYAVFTEHSFRKRGLRRLAQYDAFKQTA